MTPFSPVGLFHVAWAAPSMATGFPGADEDEHGRSYFNFLFLLGYCCCTMLYKFQRYNVVFTFFKGYIPFVVIIKYWLYSLCGTIYPCSLFILYGNCKSLTAQCWKSSSVIPCILYAACQSRSQGQPRFKGSRKRRYRFSVIGVASLIHH